MSNILTLTDSYKFSHHRMYPPDMKSMGSYFESRGGIYDKVVFFGLQYLIKKYLSSPITQEDLDEARAMVEMHLGTGIFNTEGFQSIVDSGGFLPVSIKAVPEGSLIPVGNVLMTVESTGHPWVVNFLETLLAQLWYPCTVATVSYNIRKMCLQYLLETSENTDVDYMLHDFGFRGASSVESAGIGGASHLLSFRGSDTFTSLKLIREYYHTLMAGVSIPATEHSTICSWGKDKETDAYKNLLEQFPNGLVACVSDSYDIYNACEYIWGSKLKEQVLSRGGTLVIRPDSGDPEAVVLKLLQILGTRFGVSLNKKGFKVLNPKVRLIQGDGMTPESILSMFEMLKSKKWAVDNLAFGMGGGLLQKVDRDTQKFAFKCNWVCDRDGYRGVFKSPIGDSSKQSKSGFLKLVRTPSGYETTVRDTYLDWDDKDRADVLRQVYYGTGKDAKIHIDETFEEIRQRLHAQ